jgi:hypothetical protein
MGTRQRIDFLKRFLEEVEAEWPPARDEELPGVIERTRSFWSIWKSVAVHS